MLPMNLFPNKHCEKFPNKNANKLLAFALKIKLFTFFPTKLYDFEKICQ